MPLRRLINVAYADLTSRVEDVDAFDRELESEEPRGRRGRKETDSATLALMAAARMPQKVN